MATQNKENNDQYRQARDNFNDLKIEEKAIFLVESAFSMLAHGIEAVGNVFSEQINKVYESDESEDPPKSDPPKKTTRRKTQTRKKSTSKRTSSSRSSSKADKGDTA